MATMTVTGADGNAKIKNSSVTGIQSSNGKLPPQKDISNIEVTGSKGNAEVDNSVVTGINTGQMGFIENRQQTYNIGSAHGFVGGQDMRGATVDQGGFTGQRSGPKAVFKGKVPGPALELMTVEDVQDLMTRERFPEPTRKTFEENGIDGKYFVKLLEVGVLEALGVTSPLDKMKIKTILENRSKQSS